MIKGLSTDKLPFISLDDYCPSIDWQKLHAEVSIGLAKSTWVKRYVSVGVHPDWEDMEIATHIRDCRISEYENKLYKEHISEYNTEEKLKYFICVTDAVHPFWTCFLRLNKAIERTRIMNKSVSVDCQWTENAINFPSLLELIQQLPFASIGRVMIFMTEPNNITVPHFDSILTHPDKSNDDFIWFKTKDTYKQIYVMDGDTKEKYYPPIDSKFIWFNEMDYHGTDSSPRFSFSIRIDGKFDPEVRKKILNENN